MNSRVTRTIACCCLLILWVAPVASAQYAKPVDPRSYNLGIIGAFAEVVRLGVKQLALSEVMTAEDMDDILPDAQIVAARNEVKLYREDQLLVTDLYPAGVAEGKQVLLIYAGETLNRYLALKADKARLVADGRYQGEARREIAQRFGQLLSYPQDVIDELIAQQTD